MIITDIEESKIQFVKDIKKNVTRFFIYMMISLASIVVGAVMFFYVEECYFKVPVPPEYSQRCQELCDGLVKLNTTFSMNLALTTDFIAGFNNLTDLCASKNCIEKGGVENKKCEMTDVKDFFHWFELPYSIAYTLGELKFGLQQLSRQNER